MKKVAYITKEGLINQCFEIYIDLDTPPQAPPELTAIFIDSDEDFYTLCMFRYYKDGDFKQLPTKPSQYHIWNLQTEQWEEPDGYLQTIRADGNKQINQAASQKILSKYPIYKQLNIGRTPEAQVMYDWIDNVRNLSNIATANITQAVTQDEITTIVDNFKTELGNIA